MFTALGETYDYFDGDTALPQLEQLAQYEMVFTHHDNVRIRLASTIQAREQILSDYVSLGGKLIRSGRLVFGNAGISSFYPLQRVRTNIELGTLTFDSIFVSQTYTNAQPGRTPRSAGVTAMDTTFPSFRWDSVKVQALIFGNNAVEFLPEIDLMWPNGDTRPIYTAILHESDSTGYVNPPCAVIGPRSMLFGFPLYFTQMTTAMDIMASSLEALRTQNLESPDPPAPLPSSIALHQNYPNPFNATTVIEFELPAQMEVALNLYNIRGQLVRTLFDGAVTAGHHRVMLNGEQLASGLYFFRLQAGGESQTRKLLLLK